MHNNQQSPPSDISDASSIGARMLSQFKIAVTDFVKAAKDAFYVTLGTKTLVDNKFVNRFLAWEASAKIARIVRDNYDIRKFNLTKTYFHDSFYM